MHEWALAEAVVNSAIKMAQEKKLSQVRILSLKVGEVQQIDMEVFDYAIKEISKGTILENSEIKYTIFPAKLLCNNCGNEWSYMESFESLTEEEREAIHFIPETIHVYIKCPKCKSPDFEIKEGRGVFIEEIT
ncbi:hydrogenase nickel incorporation protein HypA [Dictyoglomus thermophilum]|uniref:Hydrogenase maturation factor HypA n=2 Tax=Dictyoglomus thermophilum TaxID=14 RepID=B5YB65_DICT6|nr:hydrogenase nickel incorporation protein HypA [Dictyoglomus thermophilum]ACI19221.1 probable hydrogenase nickel incorporation protein HypA [Dictyoglomus thermophilum H-6-12]MCX7720642.1 hydrogenase nickel incorporation protein HypA [Dictyoglomus thermophilum]TYT24214.1 hydrogenase nickel incorporation protein HypA [Dictyoglomus thermophilum]